MFIYNVTVNVDQDIHDEWFRFMKEQHIPDVMATGYFSDSKMFRVLAQDEGFTYSIQYSFHTMSEYEEYKEKEAPRLQREVLELYKDKFVAFRTLLQSV